MIEKIVKMVNRSALRLALASDNNPAIAVVVVILFYIFFNLFEAMIETLIWGDRFEHWLDPFFIAAFIAYSGYVVYVCSGVHVVKIIRGEEDDQ